MCTSFKVDLFYGRHNFALSGGNTFKVALYTSSATYGASTTAYSATNEASVGGGGSGYTAGGGTLTRIDPTSSSTTAYTDFADFVWTLSGASATLTAAGCMIYNDTLTTPVADASVSTHAFTEATASGDGATFPLQVPAAGASTAILRLA
jgi:hypothetical protein